MTGKEIEINKKKYREPRRIFESSGIVNPEGAYYVRLDNVTNTFKQDIKTMVDRGRYFSMFAPRQSGKTTFLDGIRKELHNDQAYVVIILNFERYKDLDKKQFYELIEEELYSQLASRLRDVICEKIEKVEQFLNIYHLTDHISFSHLFDELNRLIKFKKIMIFIDEFDDIPLSELENFLSTLRGLYQKYKMLNQKALYSVGLVGFRDMTKPTVDSDFHYNIADHIEIPPFSLKNVRDLFSQYTEETNQPFSEEAIKNIYEETEGQPWLVNRLGAVLTMHIKPETVEPIDEKDVEKAIQTLLIEKNTHFDILYEKAKMYKETFVEIVFDNVEYNPHDEVQTCFEQYGLIRKKEFKAVIANNIYKQRYLETLFNEVAKIPEDIYPADYVLSDDFLDMERILLDFEQYIAQIGVNAFYKEKKPYEKTGQFLLTAWLYQFVREGAGELRYGVPSGFGIMDIILTYKGRKYIIETKINRYNLTRTLKDGITQVSKKYLASESVDEGYLVVFDIKTQVGEECEPQQHPTGGKKVTSLTIGIGRPD